MRYILKDGYIDEISFGATIECKNQTCTEYTGTIPTGYTSLEEWAIGEDGKLNAWKIVEGNLIFDDVKWAKLQTVFEKENEDNRYVYHKELFEVQQKVEDIKNVNESQFKKKTAEGEVIAIDNVKKAYPKVKIKNIDCYGYDKLKLMTSGKNMFPNEALTQTINGMKFTVNKDKSIKISGTATSDIEYNLAGTSTNTSSFLCFKKNINYYVYVADYRVKMYKYDGTSREQIYDGSSGKINFTDEAKEVTQITLFIPSGTKITNDTLYPMLSINPIDKQISSITIDGRSTQETRSGKNIFNKNSEFKTNGTTKTILDTGVRATITTAGTYKYFWIKLGGSELLGKRLSCRTTITPSAENNGACSIWLGSNTNAVIKQLLYIGGTGGSNSVVVPTEFPENCDTAWILLYGNINGTGNVGDYVDYTDLMVVIGDTIGDYEQYGVMPSPDYPSEVECVKGINLWDERWENGYYNRTTGEKGAGSRYIRSKDYIPITPNTDIYFNKPSDFVNYAVLFYDEEFLKIGDVAVTNTTSKTFKSPANASYFTFYGDTGVSNATYQNNIIITKGTTASDYVPYGVIQVKNVEKNLFNYLKLNDDDTVQWTAYQSFGTQFRALPIYVGKNKQVYFSTNVPTLTSGNAFYAINNIKNGTTNQINIDNSRVVNSNDDGYVYLGVVTNRQYYTEVQNNEYWIMISEGTNFTPYEPYQENITNIDLQGNELCSLPNNAKDELVVENGRAKIIKKIGKVVLNGSEEWYMDLPLTNTNRFYTARIINANSIYCLSDYFKMGTSVNSINNNDVEAILIFNNKQVGLRANNIVAPTLADFKTWLSTHNTTVYYELATTQEIDLGEVEIPTLFDGTNNISNSENADMDIVYKKIEYEEYKGSILDIDFSSINVEEEIYPSDTLYPSDDLYPKGTSVNYILIENGTIYIDVDGNETELGKGNVEIFDGSDVIYGTKDTSLEIEYCTNDLEVGSLEFLQGKSTTGNKFQILEDGSIKAHNGYFSGNLELEDENVDTNDFNKQSTVIVNCDKTETWENIDGKTCSSKNNTTSKLYSGGLWLKNEHSNDDTTSTGYGEWDSDIILECSYKYPSLTLKAMGLETSVSNAGITTPVLTQTSLEERKKNIEKLNKALDIIKEVDIYKYNLKNEDDDDKKHIGFVIGDNYQYSKEITSKNNDGADIYSMVSVCFKAIQEQQQLIERLENKIKELEEK